MSVLTVCGFFAVRWQRNKSREMLEDGSIEPVHRGPWTGRFLIYCWDLEMGKPCHSLITCAGGIQALMKSNERKLAEEDQSILMALEIPYTIIRTGLLQNSRREIQGFNFEKVETEFEQQ